MRYFSNFQPFLFVSFVLFTRTAANAATTTTTTTTTDECIVLNADGDDVTIEVYDKLQQLVNCTGSHSCYGYQINHCHNVHCQGMEACNGATIQNILSGNVSCLDKHACHHTHLHASSQSAETEVNVDCIGSAACDVAIMTNMNRVLCHGSKSCRKARIHAKNVQCTQGGTQYEACGASATFWITDCLYCGTRGCPDHVYNMCRYRLSAEDQAVVSNDYWDNTHWELDDWIPCSNMEIVGECKNIPEWNTQYEEELHGMDKDQQESEEDHS